MSCVLEAAQLVTISSVYGLMSYCSIQQLFHDTLTFLVSYITLNIISMKSVFSQYCTSLHRVHIRLGQSLFFLYSMVSSNMVCVFSVNDYVENNS